jgi:hypothetical protein
MTDRQCGSCTLCCKLLPVHHGAQVDGIDLPGSWHKPANTRCRFQRHSKGCSIYDARPISCQMWNCRWLVNDDTDDMSRPDRAHYVIDVVPDFITFTDPDDNEREIAKLEIVQVWVDPAHPEAHKDPTLRSYLERRSHEGVVALIRNGSHDAFVLLPPNMTGRGWVEKHSVCSEKRSTEEYVQGMLQARQERKDDRS